MLFSYVAYRNSDTIYFNWTDSLTKFSDGQKSDLDLLFIALAFVNLVLLISTGFIVSHRIAGPVYKLKNHLSQMSSESSEFRLRKKDFFKELKEIVDELRAKLK